MDIRIDSANIKIGMYVVELDRPWEDTNFLFQGFLIEDQGQIKELAEQCSYIIVSQERSAPELFATELRKQQLPVKKPLASSDPIAVYTQTTTARKEHTAPGGNVLSAFKQVFSELVASKVDSQHGTSFDEDYIQQIAAEKTADIKNLQEVTQLRRTFSAYSNVTAQIVQYPTTTSIDDELLVANRTAEKIEVAFGSDLQFEIDSVRVDLGDRIEVAKELLSEVVDSIARNPNAMMLLNNIKNSDYGSYRHAMDMSIMMVSFGRQLGLPKPELNAVGLGGLLHDIGKAKIPKNILDKSERLNAPELAEIRRHPVYGMELIAQMHQLDPIISEIIGNHHERFDGKGYPDGLAAAQIGIYGGMAAIVEAYSSMTSHQSYSSARTAADAITTLIALRGKAYHPALIDQFIQVVGVYPIGCLVKLSSGEIAIVIKQNKLWRLKPLITIVVDAKGKKLIRPVTIDLARQKNIDSDQELTIVCELPTGAYDVQPKEYFL